MTKVSIQARDRYSGLAGAGTEDMAGPVFEIVDSLLGYLTCLQDGGQIATLHHYEATRTSQKMP
jgi:hypothetical protein